VFVRTFVDFDGGVGKCSAIYTWPEIMGITLSRHTIYHLDSFAHGDVDANK
jgi:hypothetical protein